MSKTSKRILAATVIGSLSVYAGWLQYLHGVLTDGLSWWDALGEASLVSLGAFTVFSVIYFAMLED